VLPPFFLFLLAVVFSFFPSVFAILFASFFLFLSPLFSAMPAIGLAQMLFFFSPPSFSFPPYLVCETWNGPSFFLPFFQLYFFCLFVVPSRTTPTSPPLFGATLMKSFFFLQQQLGVRSFFFFLPFSLCPALSSFSTRVADQYFFLMDLLPFFLLFPICDSFFSCTVDNGRTPFSPFFSSHSPSLFSAFTT